MDKIVECPRDAMQGITRFIPTDIKIDYLNQLLRCNFHTLDCGSFVSSKAIPQMRDTEEVIQSLDLSSTKTKLLTIIANERGAKKACEFDMVSYLGFPLSISETFQLRNTNSTIRKGMELVATLLEMADRNEKELVVYLSMAFGNPYEDTYSEGLVTEYMGKVKDLGVRAVSVADTIGSSNPPQIERIMSSLINSFPDIEVGAHLHATESDSKKKILALKNSGCQRLDGAVLGFGGCPMADDDLVGNLPTEKILEVVESDVDLIEFSKAMKMARTIF